MDETGNLNFYIQKVKEILKKILTSKQFRTLTMRGFNRIPF